MVYKWPFARSKQLPECLEHSKVSVSIRSGATLVMLPLGFPPVESSQKFHLICGSWKERRGWICTVCNLCATHCSRYWGYTVDKTGKGCSSPAHLYLLIKATRKHWALTSLPGFSPPFICNSHQIRGGAAKVEI